VEIETKSEKINATYTKSFGLILIGRLGKPPCQFYVPEEMIYRTACG
jgi:hypothetical protein